MSENKATPKSISLYEDEWADFEAMQQYLGVKSRSELIRQLVKFARKRMTLEDIERDKN